MKKYKIMLIAFAMAVILLSGAVSVSGMSISDVDPDNKYKYEEIILPKVLQDYVFEFPDLVIYYHEDYEYCSAEASSTDDEVLPDYVLIWLDTNLPASEMLVAEVFGDYILRDMSSGYPFKHEYGIYIPATEEIYSLSYAYKLGIEGIENVFTETSLGELIGDMDGDRQLTVKDATYIQKCLAGIEEFSDNDLILAFDASNNPPLLYISDFNRDCKRDVRDATAIQKHIAGLPY